MASEASALERWRERCAHDFHALDPTIKVGFRVAKQETRHMHYLAVDSAVTRLEHILELAETAHVDLRRYLRFRPGLRLALKWLKEEVPNAE